MFDYLERGMAPRSDFPRQGAKGVSFIFQQGIQPQFFLAPDYGKMNRPQPILSFFWKKKKHKK